MWPKKRPQRSARPLNNFAQENHQIQLRPVHLRRQSTVWYLHLKRTLNPFKETILVVAGDETTEIRMGMERAACEKAALPSASFRDQWGLNDYVGTLATISVVLRRLLPPLIWLGNGLRSSINHILYVSVEGKKKVKLRKTWSMSVHVNNSNVCSFTQSFYCLL